MANINLLPWREELREQKKKEFYTFLMIAVLCAIGLLLLWNGWLAKRIGDQAEQNQYVQTEIDKLAEKAKLLDELKSNREALLKRVTAIQDLQGKRPKIVHIFDELTKLVPEGVFITQLVRTEEQLGVQGTAESNNDVSDLMRSLGGSGWFAEPVLKEVKASEAFGERANDFQLVVAIADLDGDEANQHVITDASLVEFAGEANARIVADQPPETHTAVHHTATSTATTAHVTPSVSSATERGASSTKTVEGQSGAVQGGMPAAVEKKSNG